MKIVLTYKMTHNWNVQELLTEYQKLLQRAIDEIWENTTWKEKKVKHRYSIGNRGIQILRDDQTNSLLPENKRIQKRTEERVPPRLALR
ncbi:MAG: hypothetical protein ACTSR0_03120 [Candidatus Asgardarchaeia archaeon]